MLGLIGAYIYLDSAENKNDRLFQTIVYNLQNAILRNSTDTPDVWALNLLSYKHFKRAISAEEQLNCVGLPMLRVAFDVIRQDAATHPDLIREGDIRAYVAENQMFGSAYNTFASLNPVLFYSVTGNG